MAAITIERRIEETAGRSSGFDYMRIILAVAVVAWHSCTTSYGNDFAREFLTTPFRPLVAFIVPMFFALSGFLVAGSLFRNSIAAFVTLRVIRIYPALSVEVLLSAFLLGTLLTTTPLPGYFASPIFHRYLLNLIGWIHYELPGLFQTNPVSGKVNGQLWTVPWELWCYVSLTTLALVRFVRLRALFVGATALVTVALFWAGLQSGHVDQENGVVGPALLTSFLWAVALYLYRDKLPWSAWLCGVCVAVMIALLELPGGDNLIGLPGAYATIYLGLLNPGKIGLLKGADYSYGLYIYHYAIQQALVFLFPFARHWYVILPASLLLTTAFAAFSWHLVEKPALSTRRWLIPWIDGRIGQFAGLFGRKPKLMGAPATSE